MNDPSKTCDPMTSPIISNVIGSQESVGGHSPCDLPVGQMTGLFGQVLPRVNHSAPMVETKGRKIVATCGRFSYRSSRTIGLQRSLESNLRGRLPLGGSTAYAMTWKRLITPSGRRYCRLAVSERRTNGRDCGGWPTPNTEGWRSDGELRLLSKLCQSANEFLVLSHRACRSKQMKWWNRGLLPKESRGRINLSLYRWLMGFPIGWDRAEKQRGTETP